ncbi:hypothetical protein F5Y19DRAFT_420708 [Xylariaceae sp. FL1651]|nr:hypothetical protein F5Y19DRAFT_420708 [Xylariaceae sp. FL1651]
MVMPNATATTTGHPISGSGVANGVSVSVVRTQPGQYIETNKMSRSVSFSYLLP